MSPTSDSKFCIGETVRLNDGGPVMLIEHAIQVRDHLLYRCIWTTSLGGVMFGDFAGDELIRVATREENVQLSTF
jgi:uncharacterized protein YodC (DUF2158 family)